VVGKECGYLVSVSCGGSFGWICQVKVDVHSVVWLPSCSPLESRFLLFSLQKCWTF